MENGNGTLVATATSLGLPSSERRTPELSGLVERLGHAVNRFDGLVCEVNTKLQRIKVFCEPEEVNKRTENPTDTVTEVLHILIGKVEEYNLRLDFSLRHLNEIV